MNLSRSPKTPFIWIHLESLEYFKGNGNALLVYAHLIKRAGHDGKCWQSIEGMATQLGLSAGTIKRSIAYLLKTGMVERISRPGLTSNYRITDITDWNDPGGEPGSKTTQVKNDPGGEPGSKTTQVPGSKTTQVPGSKTTHELDPIELDPNKLDPVCEAYAHAHASEIEKPIAEVIPPRTAAINLQSWLEAYNQAAPGKWPRLSISFMMAPRTQEAIRGYCAGYENPEIGLEYFKAALAYLRVCEDGWWREKALQPAFIFNPDKLPLSQFFGAAEAEKVNAERISEFTDEQIDEARPMSILDRFLRKQRQEGGQYA